MQKYNKFWIPFSFYILHYILLIKKESGSNSKTVKGSVLLQFVDTDNPPQFVNVSFTKLHLSTIIVKVETFK